MSYKNITIINKDGKKYHPETNISNVLGIDKKADKDYVDKKLNNKADIEYVDKKIEDAEAINTTLQNTITSSKISKEKLEEENKRSESNIVTIAGLNKKTVTLIEDLKSTSEYANLNKQQLEIIIDMAKEANIDLLESISNADLDGINQAIKDLKQEVGDIPEVFHDAPRNKITEEMIPKDFDYGLTLCNQGWASNFPSINKYGVTYTIIGRNTNYAQVFITAEGDIWARRSSDRDSWNGKWYNSKKEIDSIKKEVDNLKQSGVEINKVLVDALNSKDVSASTSDSIRDNVKKVEDIEANYDWKIKNLLHYSNFNNGWYKWQENQNALFDRTDDNGLKVTFNQTNSTPGLKRAEADIFLDKTPKTLSFLVKQSNPSNSTIAYFFDKDGEKVAEGSRLTHYKEKGYTRYIMTFSLPRADKYQLMILTNSPKSKDDYMVIKDIMIENGREANIYRPFILQNHDYRKVDEWATLTGNGESKRFYAGYYPDAFYVKTDIRNLKSYNIKKGATVGGVTGTYEPKIGLREKTYYYYDLREVSGRGTKYLNFPAGRSATDMMYGKIEGGSEPGYRWGEFSLINGEQTDGTSTYHLEKVVPLTPDSEHIEVTVYNWKKEHEIRVTVLEPYIID